jgi:hypothetical protein
MTVAGYTYKALQDEVLSFQFSETKYRPLVKVWLNSAQQTAVIQSEFRSQESTATVTTSANAATYALPTDYSRLIDFFYNESHELLSPMDVRDFDALPESTGRPYAYAMRGNELVLYPTPDAVYTFTLRYWRLPKDMSADSDEPEIPAQYHDLLIAYAMQKAFMREDDLQMAKAWEEQWNGGLLKMRGEVQSDHFDGPRQVGGSWGDAHGIPPYASWR